MCGISISEIHRGIKCRGILYFVPIKYRDIPSGGIDDQYTSHQAQFT